MPVVVEAGRGRVQHVRGQEPFRLERRQPGPADLIRLDAMEKAPSAAAPAGLVTGPYAALARRGDFSGFVKTKAGELFVTVRVSKKDPGGEKPLVYLDGLAARRNRSDMMADKFRDEGDRTVISILLPGQGETLLRDVEKTGGNSLADDLRDSDQAQAVVDALDALGVTKPVDIFGLSYGGAIAAATKRDHPDRIDQALLAAPHVQSEARAKLGPMGWAMLHNPWNFMGMSMYRAAAKSTLSNAFGTPPLFKDHPGAFAEALFRLSMGIDDNELYRTLAGVKGVHILAVPGDSASPPALDEKAVKAAHHGELTMAPDAFNGMHDIVSASPELVVMWVTQTLNPDRLPDVMPRLTEAAEKRTAEAKAAAEAQKAAAAQAQDG
jgi:pimeloyl-ACP methyl ester carboxylesterase